MSEPVVLATPEPDLSRLRRDLRQSAASLTTPQARFLVDSYYALQKFRIAAANQVRALAESGEEHACISVTMERMLLLERDVASYLGRYVEQDSLGCWALSQVGIGPVLSAGLLAHIDLERAKSVSSVWRFAGLDPTSTWAKGQKRPWNARLKVLCWKIGQSFVKVSGRPDAFYGQVYRARKELEVERNERGDNAALAAATLEKKTFRSDTQTRACYRAGKLPPGRLELRAERYAVKMFLSHYWQVGYEIRRGRKAPAPWIIQHGGHVDLVPPPNWPMDEKNQRQAR